jgi:hypothetical protein
LFLPCPTRPRLKQHRNQLLEEKMAEPERKATDISLETTFTNTAGTPTPAEKLPPKTPPLFAQRPATNVTYDPEL